MLDIHLLQQQKVLYRFENRTVYDLIFSISLDIHVVDKNINTVADACAWGNAYALCDLLNDMN